MQISRSTYIVVPKVDNRLCQACARCLARQACRTRAILVEDAGQAPFIDAARCYGCRACLPACPFGAIVVNSESLS